MINEISNYILESWNMNSSICIIFPSERISRNFKTELIKNTIEKMSNMFIGDKNIINYYSYKHNNIRLNLAKNTIVRQMSNFSTGEPDYNINYIFLDSTLENNIDKYRLQSYIDNNIPICILSTIDKNNVLRTIEDLKMTAIIGVE